MAPVFLVFWPGIIHWDSAHLISDAHRGVPLDWWSGIGTLILQGWFSVGLGVPLVWVLIVAVNVVGIFGLLRAVLRRVPAACVTVAFVLFPPIYGQLATLSRDSAYVGFALLAFATLAKLTRDRTARRGPWLSLAFASAVMAAVSRQNGVAVIAAVVLFALLHGRSWGWRRVTAAALTALLAAGGAYEGLRLAGAAMGVRNVDPERATFVYDLAAISVATNHDLFPEQQLRALPAGGATPQNMSEAWLKQHFRPSSVTSVRGVKEMDVGDTALAQRETKLLESAWIRAIKRHPLAYLHERARLYLGLLGVIGLPTVAKHGFFFGYQGLESSDNYGHPLKFTANYDAASDVLGVFIGKRAVLPLDRPWIYMAWIVAAVVYMRRRRSAQLPVALSMCAAIGLSQALFFFVLMATSFRYEYLVVPTALLFLGYALATRADGRAPRRSA